MALPASGNLRIITDIDVKTFGDNTVYKFYAGINEGKDKNGEYIRNGIDCEVWNKTGAILVEYVGKGGMFFGTGNIIKNEWADKETGDKRSKHILKLNRIELLGRAANPEESTNSSSGFTPVDDDDDSDVPF